MSFLSISSTADCLESVFEPLMAKPHLITGHVLHQHQSVLVSARSLLVLPLVSMQECRWCVHNYLGLPCIPSAVLQAVVQVCLLQGDGV